MNRIARLTAPLVLAASVVLIPATAQARPVPEPVDVVQCAAGYHLVGATCFKNNWATTFFDRLSGFGDH